MSGMKCESDLIELKRRILRVCSHSKEGHVPSAFSILDLLWVLYGEVLSLNPKKIRDPQRDYFVLSKGHGSLGLYAVLAQFGYIDWITFETFGDYNSPLGGHPDSNKIPGVEASTGSLGHGLPFATGIAYAQKISGSSSKVFVLIGDGEANEGTVWESLLIASQQSLKNLKIIVDFNHSTDRAVSLGNLTEKFHAFGFSTETINGHDHFEIKKSLLNFSDRPSVVIAETIKGNGCPTLENNPAWHHKSPSSQELTQLIQELYR